MSNNDDIYDDECYAKLSHEAIVFEMKAGNIEWEITPYNGSIYVFKKQNGITIDSIDIFGKQIIDNIQTAVLVHEEEIVSEKGLIETIRLMGYIGVIKRIIEDIIGMWLLIVMYIVIYFVFEFIISSL